MPSLKANEVEIADFAKLLKTDTAKNMLSVFMNEQAVAKAARKYAKGAEETKQVAVIGAGIMGGGIAYQSALKNVSVVMKDINQEALDLGISEADKNSNALLKKGRLDEAGKKALMARIKPTLDNADLSGSDMVVEAVIEKLEVKQAVLADLENHVGDDCIIASNTSTILIDRMAESLQRPENFCGMHFFNPVPLMKLVEIIRGKKTSDETISKAVNYALQLGKNPIVVNNCPAFLVNRTLFPSVIGTHMLIEDGVDFQQIDRVATKYGWPMGMLYLSDVVGLDTVCHCLDVLAADIPERMAEDYQSASSRLVENDRKGQKNGAGYFKYVKNEKGRLDKVVDEGVYDLLYPNGTVEVSGEEIEQRIMIPMCLEMVRCLEEGIVASPAEADMAMLWGVGFPRFRGGVIRQIDTIGIDNFCNQVEKYQHLGGMYEMPELLKQMQTKGERFY